MDSALTTMVPLVIVLAALAVVALAFLVIGGKIVLGLRSHEKRMSNAVLAHPVRPNEWTTVQLAAEQRVRCLYLQVQLGFAEPYRGPGKPRGFYVEISVQAFTSPGSYRLGAEQVLFARDIAPGVPTVSRGVHSSSDSSGAFSYEATVVLTEEFPVSPDGSPVSIRIVARPAPKVVVRSLELIGTP